MERKVRYDYTFKLECVELVLKTNYCNEYFSKAKAISISNIRKWVDFFLKFGKIGLIAPKNQSHSIDFKLEVLKSIEKKFLSLRASSLKFSIPN